MRFTITLLIFLIFSSSYSVYSKNKTWKCINEKGETIFTIEAISVYEFSNGLARVYKNTLVNNQWITGYGFVNKKGEVVIPCNLEKADDFYGPVTWVKTKGSKYFDLMDKTGKIISTEKKYERVGNFYEWQTDISAVYKDKKMGFVNTEGQEIIPCKYYGSNAFTEGLACVSLYDSEMYGFIDKQGKEVIPLKFKQTGTSSFKNGMARAQVNGKTVLIDKKGDVVFRTDKGNIQGVSGDMILVFTKPNRKGWGWLSFENEFVIDPIYEHATNFNESGYAMVEKNGLYGLIDKKGNILLDHKYQSIYSEVEEDGYISAVYPSDEPKSLMETDKDLFDASFQPIQLDDEVTYLFPAGGGSLMKFKGNNGKIGYMNRNFEITIPAQFDRVQSFSEGLAWAR